MAGSESQASQQLSEGVQDHTKSWDQLYLPACSSRRYHSHFAHQSSVDCGLCIQSSFVQDVTMADDVEKEGTSALNQHQHRQQMQVAGEREVQPWEARLAGHAEAILQLDKDSLCRLSDPCQHPSKRSKSCPPDSFGATPHQPADSTDAVHTAHSNNDLPSDCDHDAMSGQALDAASARQTGQVVQLGVDLHQRLSDALTMPEGTALCHMAARTVSSVAPATLAAQQPYSLDMTQPNLTPANQQCKLAAQSSTDLRTAPVRPFPSTSLLKHAADLDPDLELNRLAGAGPSSSRACHKLNPRNEQAAEDQIGQSQQQLQQQQQPAIGQQGSGSVGLGKGKAAKWKQRAGLRDNGFGENEHPLLPPDGLGSRQGKQPCLQMHFPLTIVIACSCLTRIGVCCVLGFMTLLHLPFML